MYQSGKLTARNGGETPHIESLPVAIQSVAMSASPTPQSHDIGWYVHLPFCRTKCGYCDFYSLPTISTLIPDLVAAIRHELTTRNPDRGVRTIFVGGGTPTELPEENLDDLLGAIGRMAGDRVVEWTVEANPSSASELKLDVLRKHGVNRVSFGAQSFFPDELKVLERIHDPAHIAESVLAARRAGIDNVNIDLIYGIPGQSMARWRESMQRAIDLGTDHLSCYALMYEPGTAMTKFREQGRVTPCDESLEADMFEATIDVLAAAGYEQYEISNFARPGRHCEANLVYWRNQEYLGVGPSAVSYLNGLRRKNIADVRKYIARVVENADDIVVESESLDSTHRAGETAIQLLRLIDGIDREQFTQTTGFDACTLFAVAIEAMRGASLIDVTEKAIRLTRRGLLLSNYVMRAFLACVDEDDRSASADRRFVTLNVDRNE